MQPTPISRNAYILAAITKLRDAYRDACDVRSFLEALGDRPDDVKTADVLAENLASFADELEAIEPTEQEQAEDDAEAHEGEMAANAASSVGSSHGRKTRKRPHRQPPE